MVFETTLIGNAGQDAEVKEVNGRKIANVSVAHTERYMSNGEQKEKTIWVRLVVYGDRAEKFAEYVKKGKLIMAKGTIQSPSAYIKDGQAKASLDMVVDTYRILSAKE